MWVWGAPMLAAVLLLVTGLLVATAYAVAARRDVDATTEVAALVVLAAGVTAGLGEIRIASGIIAITALLLFEKSRLHDLVTRLQGDELDAAFRFAVMAVVVLPLLPEGPYGPFGGVRPRELWLLVLFFSGLSFAGYLARRIVGASRGYPVAGLLGGMVSSTSVTWSFAGLSRKEEALALPLARGVVAANTVLYVRVLVAASVLSQGLAATLVPLLATPFLIGAIVSAAGVVNKRSASPSGLERPKNPLQLRSALEMALLFQGVLFAVHFAEGQFGTGGILATAAVAGLNDADALTLSMAKGVSAGTFGADLAARAVAVGLLSNTCVKGILALSVGRGRFRALVAGVLATMAVALALGAWLL
ncbi:MAG: DUF4010 domain-containing protein, partial [Acidobacteriota bacterium]|nr:DUF4010 domain-containing protein [Acidobacteriota bacterium]